MKESYHEPKELLHFAQDKLYAAYFLANEDPKFYDAAGYLAQLGIELLLKCLICLKNDRIPYTHKFDKLHSEEYLDESYPLDENSGKINRIDKFYGLRYPNFENPIEIGDEDFEMVKEIHGTLLEKIGEMMTEEDMRYEKFKKGGRVLLKREKNSK